MKPVVIFDIDSTLLNSNRVHAFTVRHFWNRFRKIAGRLAKRDWRGAWKLTLPDRQAAAYLLGGGQEGFLGSPAAKDSFLSPDYYRKSLFEDAVPTLKKLQGRAGLGIFSQGPQRLQRAKLKQSGIEKYFDPGMVFVFPPPKISRVREMLDRLPREKIYFVDDRLGVVLALANRRVRAFRIRRSLHSAPRVEPVSEIGALGEILNFL